MRTFDSPEAFGSFLIALAQQVDDRAAQALREGAQIVAEDAKARIGHYDGNDWPQLAQFTRDERTRLGFSPDDPLFRTGALRDAITSEGVEHSAVAGVKFGTTNKDGVDLGDIASEQEMGTPDAKRPIPPRPFLAPAGFAREQEIAEKIALAAADAFAGKI